MPTPQEEYRTIPLTRGQVAIVDAADYEWLSSFKWLAQWNSCTRSFYACRRATLAEGGRGNVAMARLILGIARGDRRQGDHINHDTLDNRRQNLRIVSRSQNCSNRRIRSDNTSGFKGVSLFQGKYRARIMSCGKMVFLGDRDTAEEAHKLYSEAARRLHGEFAKI